MTHSLRVTGGAVTTRQDSETSTPTFRLMRGDDIEQVFEVIQVSFGDVWPNLPLQVPKIDHLRWKLSGPQAAPDDPEVAEMDGQIVGYVGGSSRDVWVRGQRRRGWHGGDMCIHPDYQERGLTTPWRDWRESELDIAETVTLSEGSTHPRLLRSQRRRADRAFLANQVDRLTLPLDLTAMLELGTGSSLLHVPRALAHGARMLAKMGLRRLRWGAAAVPTQHLGVVDIDSFDERADTLWDEASTAFDFAVVRDADYLNWRYCDPRAGVYRVRGVIDEGQLLGFIVTGARGPKRDDGEIVDLLVAPGRDDVLQALVADAIQRAKADGAVALTLLMPRSHPYRETFLRAGFVRSHHVTNMGFRRRPETAFLNFLEEDARARVHIAYGDADHV
jgi:GNAT superfamily N-acetyltransferase